MVASAQLLGKKVVFVTGVFDVLHSEHRRFLERAQAAGDVLVVGIETDQRVREMKGPDRPRDNESTRLKKVSDLPTVDAAALLPVAFRKPEHYRAIIDLLRPNSLAVSSHSPHQDKKQAILEAFGGTLEVVHEHNPLVSTTQILAEQK
ncbi:adenylyltransferase/cytidyltransferase family protein [Candidatus Woesebacteria bacterium]|nr:adenylyltransferase/cytidyltransferase family protein [Candidatus Woesebacteria bacterium]